ncbi:biopolymer transporter ExbD [uncultured Sphaerochaeta sp.]|uniref:biopolymer transporter ExbD n=1 Tax=uncultured Sphaerochaeta sp. TaxID=886478 RepID=UPI002A0A3FDF|nr:biopolymer transporter ExbD [uncultured Sphaerochaeta sp.]
MRRRRQDLAQPSDIAFLLIIFFLLLAGVAASQSLDLKIGPSSKKTIENLVLTLHQDGSLSEGDTPTTLNEIAKQMANTTNLTVLVEQETPWQEIVDILSFAQNQATPSVQLRLLP